MAATPLTDDGISVTYQLDDGSTVKVARDAALRAGAPMPSPIGSAPTMGQPPASPTGVPSFTESPIPVAPPIVSPPPVVDSIPGAPTAQLAPAQPSPMPNFAQTAGAGATGGAQGVPAKPVPPPAPTRFGAATAGYDAGQQQREQALNDNAIAEQAGLQRTVNVLDDRNAQLDAIRAKQEADQQKSLSEIERRSSAVDAAIADYSKVKIDPNRLSNSLSTGGKAGMIFFQILAGLGKALKHQGGENPAVDMWLKQQEQDVRLQMDARDQKRTAIGDAKDRLGMFKDLAQTRAGQFSLAMAAETDKAAKTLEAIATQTKSDMVRGNALEAMGVMKQQSANFKGEWAKAEFGADMEVNKLKEQQRAAKASEGIAGGHLALARQEFKEGVRRFDLDYAQKERMAKDALDEKRDAFKAAGDMKSVKLAEQQSKDGVYDPTTGKPMLQPEGEKMMRDADALDKAARTAKDPAKAAEYQQRAKDMRDQAEIQHGFKTPQAEKVKESIGHAQDLVDKIADIKRTLGTDPSSVDRETWAKLGSDFEQAKAAWIESVGARVSSREMDAISDMFGHSPEDMTTRAFGRGKLGATLEAISDGTVATTQSKIRAQGYRGTWKAQPPKTDDIEGIKGQTSIERGEAAKPSPVARAERAVLNPLGFNRGGAFDPETRAEEGGPVTPTGLSTEDTAQVTKLAKQYANGNDEARAKIADQMTAAALSPRLPIASGVIQLIKGENPELYGEIVKNLPADRKQDLGILDIPARGAKR